MSAALLPVLTTVTMAFPRFGKIIRSVNSNPDPRSFSGNNSINLLSKGPVLLSSFSSCGDRVMPTSRYLAADEISLVPHFTKLTVKYNEGSNSRTEYEYAQNHACNLQKKSNAISAFVYGVISVFGLIVFGYFFWQARFNLAMNFKWCLAWAILGLVVLGYGFYETLNCIERLS
jgi:hypothetical protein